MDFHIFYTICVFKVKETTGDIPTELPCLSDLENPSQLAVREVLMILSYTFLKFSQYSCFRINCWYFYRATLFRLPQNLGQLPVQGYLKGTDDCILWIFTISSLFMFSRSRNPLLTFILRYDVLSDLENPIQLPVWGVLVILSYKFLKFSHY